VAARFLVAQQHSDKIELFPEVFLQNMRFLVVFLVTALCLSPATQAKKPVQVVVSIRPLALLTEDLLREAGLADVKVEQLIKGANSPHHFTLKASDMQHLDQADLLVWVGPMLETSLVSVVEKKNALQRLTLAELPDLYWPASAHSEHADHHHAADPHIWLNPGNAIRIAQGIAEQLTPLLATAEKQKLSEALVNFDKQLKRFSERTEKTVNALDLSAGVAAYHDSLHHFLDYFGIKQVAALTEVPEEQVGMRTLMALKKQALPRCMLADLPEIRAAEKFGKTLGWPVVEVDALGVTRDSYLAMLEGLTAALVDCAAKSPE